MKSIVIFFLLLALSNSLDNSTLSNYKDITLTKLEGIFEPDFKEKIVKGSLTYTFTSNVKGEEIILDTKYLSISSVKDANSTEPYEFENGEENEYLGVPLVIKCPYEPEQEIKITIDYNTTTDGSSAQFLNKEQTIGGTHEYFFTMSEMILGRELLPSQDTPAVKFPFYLGIKVPETLHGMISGLFDKDEKNEDGTKTFYYKQEIPIPNYLIALAAGNIVGKEIDENITVYSEPEFVDNVYNELHDFLPDILEKCESYMGKYEWGKYNVLVLPRSFPYSGMENPCLTFSSPCLINGDKSLVDIVAHELIHSWSGNLVTNENWRDFWLNEGITMFLQRKVISMWKEEDYAKMDSILGLFYIENYLDYFGEDSTYTTLRPDFQGKNPDDFYSDIPYEKGYNFMYFIESLIGNETMKEFFQSYFEHFKHKSLDFYAFKDYFIEFCQDHNVTEETLNKIDWDAWIFAPGRCPVKNNFTNKYMEEVDEALEKFINEEIDKDLEDTFNSWMHTSKTVFMNTLEQRYEFLTEKQHEFLTNTLKLYTGQDFLVQTNYFRLILGRTDKFYDNELEGLMHYLSNNGALDYMAGIYEYLYRRDEILAEETLDSLRTFYHPLMIYEAEEEFESAKRTFPILSFDLKNEKECSFLSLDRKLEIVVEQDALNKTIDIEKGVQLVSEDNNIIDLQCHIDPNEAYCYLKKEIEHSGVYHLSVPVRIQNQTFAIKVFEGNNTIQTYAKEIKIDETKTQKEFDIDYRKDENETIELFFSAVPDETVKVLYNDKEVECELKEKTMECKINNITLDIKDVEETQKYELKVVDLCGGKVYSFNVNINYQRPDEEKEEESKEEESKEEESKEEESREEERQQEEEERQEKHEEEEREEKQEEERDEKQEEENEEENNSDKKDEKDDEKNPSDVTPPSPSPNEPNENNEKKTLDTVYIVIIIVAGVLVLLVVAFLIHRAISRKKNVIESPEDIGDMSGKQLLSEI